MKKLIYLWLAFMLPLALAAQDRTISGKVTDGQDGTALQGVTVQVLTSSGKGPITTTDNEGNYSITVSSNAMQLVFTYTGMLSITETINGRSIINIGLRGDNTLNDVVVVGYGTQRRKNLTGAVTTVAAKDLVKNSNNDVTNTLTGRAPGVRVVQLSSQPGRFDSQIDIRGFSFTDPGDIEGNQQGGPLIIVDGVQRDKSGFDRLDPNEIESISVLKDATASIYGVKAANGVILVTTKRGASGKVAVSYTTHLGKQFITRYPKLSDGFQYATLYNENQINNFISGRQQITPPRFSDDQLEDYKNGTTEGTNYLKLIMDNGTSQQQHNVTISGGTDRARYFISGGYFDEGGLLSSNLEYAKKYNLRANLEGDFNKDLSFGVNVAFINSISNQPNGAIWAILKNAWQVDPTEPIYANNDPKYLQQFLSGLDHPIAQTSEQYNGYNLINDKFLTTTFTLQYKVPFVSGLSAKLLYAYDSRYSFNRSFRKQFLQYNYNPATETYNQSLHAGPSQLGEFFGQGKTNDLQASLNYVKTLGRHHFTVLGLYEEIYRRNNNHNAQTQYVIDAIDQLAAGDRSRDQVNSGFGESANRSYVGKINYEFDGEFLGEFGFRYDGSSSFPSNARWGFFPYGSVGWRISEQPWMKAMSWVDNFKLRASYGVSGDDAIQGGSYQWLTGYTYPSTASGSNAGYVFGGGFVRGVDFKNSANPNITWYTSTTTDIGLELSLWRGKFSLEADVFRRDRDGLLGNRISTVPATYGVNLPRENINEDRTQGLELVLGHRNQVGEIQYSINSNFTYTRTRNRYVEEQPANSSYDYWRNRSNGRFNDVVWGYTVDGQFQNFDEIYAAPIQDGAGNRTLLPGDLKYVDVNGDGIIDGKDQAVIARGGGKPSIYFGMDFNISYKGFDFSMLLQGASLYSVYYQDQLSRPFYFGTANPIEMFNDRWHRADINDPNSAWIPGRFPSTGQRQNYKGNNTFFNFNATYARIKSIEIGYSIPKEFLNRFGLGRIRVFVNAYNLATFTGKGLDFVDPEYTDDRLYSYSYPITMNINFGASVSF